MVDRLQILADEITTDSLGRNYAAMSNREVADDLNTVYRTRNRKSMTASEVLNAIDSGEYDALSNVNEDRFWKLLSIGDLDPFGVEATLMQNIFGASTTITTLQALRLENVSRGVERGIGVVGEGDVWDVRNG